MRNAIRSLSLCGLLAAGSALSACGGGGAEVRAGAGVITITAFSPSPVPGGVPTPFTITGTNFETTTGTTARVIFHALGGATPFYGGTEAIVEVEGSVDSDTSISGTTPAATVCGVVAIAFEVTAILESGVRSNTFAGGIGGLVFTAPTVTSVTPTPIPAEIPTLITVNGTGFGPVGGTATVRFISDGGFTLFGDASLAEIDVQGSITSATAISVTAPLAAVCGAVSRTASIAITLNANGSCSAPGVSVLTYLAPTIVSINNPSVPALVPGGFVITGTGFGPVGAVIQLTFTAATPIFANATQTTTIVSGTIATSMTISGTFPAATTCGLPTETAVVRAAFNAGSCADSPAAFVTYRRPTLTAIVTAFPGNSLRETLRTAFTLTGTDLSFPIGSSSVLCRFQGAGTLYQVDANGVGTNTFDAVSAVVISNVSAGGTSPVIQATAAVPLATTVQLFYPDGSCSNALAVTWAPPPIVTSVTNNELAVNLPRGVAGPVRTFSAACFSPMLITGTSFAATATVRVFNQALGFGTPIGGGVLQTTPATITPIVITATTIVGDSPVDPAQTAASVQAAVRVTNPDGQVSPVDFTATDFVFTTRIDFLDRDTTVQAGSESEGGIAIDPTNPLNIAAIVHDAGSGFNNVNVSRSADGGRTWTRISIGVAQDGLAGTNFRFDPRIAWDRFGNLFAMYIGRDTTGVQTRRMIMLQSNDKGATFGNVRIAFTEVGSSLDRGFLAIGPNGANLAQDAIYLGWRDSSAVNGGGDKIIVAATTSTAAAVNVGAFAAPVNATSTPANLHQFAFGAVKNNGDLVVSWVDYTAAPQVMRLSIDPLGAFAGAGFGGEITTPGTSNMSFFEFPPASPVRGFGSNLELTAVRTGPFAGRVLLTYGDEIPLNVGAGNFDVRSFFTDNNGLTFSPLNPVNDFSLGSQVMCSVQADRTLGTIYATWYDTRDDATGVLARRYATASFDGGVTWKLNFQVSDASSNGTTMDGNEYLDYCGVDALGGCAFCAHADNSNSTANNPNGGTLTDWLMTRFQIGPQ